MPVALGHCSQAYEAGRTKNPFSTCQNFPEAVLFGELPDPAHRLRRRRIAVVKGVPNWNFHTTVTW
jgi:hypothetical protein